MPVPSRFGMPDRTEDDGVKTKKDEPLKMDEVREHYEKIESSFES